MPGDFDPEAVWSEEEQEEVRELAWNAALNAERYKDDVSISSRPDWVDQYTSDEHDVGKLDVAAYMQDLAEEFCRPEYDEFYQDLMDASYPFKRVTGGARVYIKYNQGDLGKMAEKHGFAIENVKPLSDGPFGAVVIIKHKRNVRTQSDGRERRNRVNLDD